MGRAAVSLRDREALCASLRAQLKTIDPEHSAAAAAQDPTAFVRGYANLLNHIAYELMRVGHADVAHRRAARIFEMTEPSTARSSADAFAKTRPSASGQRSKKKAPSTKKPRPRGW